MFPTSKFIFLTYLVFAVNAKSIINSCQTCQNVNNFNKQVRSSQTEKFLYKQKNIHQNKNSTFLHTEDEIKLSNKFKIPKKNFCSKDHGLGINLFVMVVSSPNNFEARNAIRQTWGEYSIKRGSKLLFLVGLSSMFETNEKIIKENEKYYDILQGQYQDAYFNLTLKSLSIINWMNDNCKKAKYVMKVDDDMFVNMPLLIDFVEKNEYKNAIIGKIHKKWLPQRNPSSKYFVPQTAYSEKVYPNFATGPAYLIHRDAIRSLIQTVKSKLIKVLKLEDVVLTGIIAEKAGVKRVDNFLFKNVNLKVSNCNFKTFITAHKYKPKEILKLWSDIFSKNQVDCF